MCTHHVFTRIVIEQSAIYTTTKILSDIYYGCNADVIAAVTLAT